MEEILLIQKAQKGDIVSLNLIMEKYKKLVMVISKKYFIIGADFNDVIQEGMIGLFNALTKFDIYKNVQFKTFANLCINRQIISAIKKAYKNSKNELLDDVNLDILNNNDRYLSPEEDIILNEEYNDLKKEIKSKLSNLEQKILTKFLNDKNNEEISNELNLSKKSIENALFRIRNKLKYLNK